MRDSDHIIDELLKSIRPLRFGAPVAYVYNPLEYALAVHAQYLTRYGAGTKEALFVGMNPGPWGMAQTGIPFGEVGSVKEWMRLDGPVGAPQKMHPKRQVEGLNCTRSEVSGRRLWGWAKRFGAPEKFFSRFFVINYCPLLFLEASGKNIKIGRAHV